jgi:benzoylformate decarboxylase
VVGDIKASLQAMAPLLEAATALKAAAYEALRREARQVQQRRLEKMALMADAQMGAPVTTPLVAAREVVLAIGPEIPIVDEAIATSVQVRGFLHSMSPRQYSFLRGGGLGWGMPAAVGCSLGLGRQPVVCLVGDGAALYSPQALWTAAHQNLPVTFIVMNNREYNVLKNFMKGQSDYVSARSNRFIAMDLEKPVIDYLALARSMGVRASRIEKATDIASAVEAAIASGTPNLIEIVISAS